MSWNTAETSMQHSYILSMQSLNFVSLTIITDSGASRNFFSEGSKITRSGGQKSPSGVKGQSPSGGLRAKPAEVDEFMSTDDARATRPVSCQRSVSRTTV